MCLGLGMNLNRVMHEALIFYNIQLSPEGEVNSGVEKKPPREALFTDPEGDSFCKLKTSLSRNFVYNLQTFRGLSVFLRFCCKFSMKIIVYLPVNTDKPKFFFFFGICLYDCFIYRLNFMLRKCLEVRRHLGSGRKTVNSQGYSELREPIKTREKCYSLIW